jgi:drug/metabolite transporter (DMT)-like permease
MVMTLVLCLFLLAFLVYGGGYLLLNESQKALDALLASPTPPRSPFIREEKRP